MDSRHNSNSLQPLGKIRSAPRRQRLRLVLGRLFLPARESCFRRGFRVGAASDVFCRCVSLFPELEDELSFPEDEWRVLTLAGWVHERNETRTKRTGYAWFYGLSLIVGSYPVLFVSIAAHAAQFAFLVWFENPRAYPLSLFYPGQFPLLPSGLILFFYDLLTSGSESLFHRKLHPAPPTNPLTSHHRTDDAHTQTSNGCTANANPSPSACSSPVARARTNPSLRTLHYPYLHRLPFLLPDLGRLRSRWLVCPPLPPPPKRRRQRW